MMINSRPVSAVRAIGTVMLLPVLLILVPIGSAFADTSSPALSPGSQSAKVASVFERMSRTLPGKWKGTTAHGTADNPTSDWEGARVEYVLTAGGTALIEKYVEDDGQSSMTTVYHVDNNDLRATHFCGARNHPRMIARSLGPDGRTVEFDFVDVANLKSADSYHTRGLLVELVSEDEIILTFRGLQDGKASHRTYKFRKDSD